MRSFHIQERIPEGPRSDQLLEELGWEILSRLEGLEVPEMDLDLEDGWVKVTLSGPDEGVAENLVIKTYGRLLRIDEVQPGQEFRGYLVDVGKVGYGVYFKAVLGEKDVLYPLFEMRQQLARGRKVPARMIAKAYGFEDDLSLELRVLRRDEKGIYASLSPRQLAMIRGWVNRGIEVLFVIYATPKQVRRVLLRTGHSRDVRVIRLSFLSHALVCKRGTNAKGLIPRLGPHLPGAVFSTITPEKVSEVLKGPGG